MERCLEGRRPRRFDKLCHFEKESARRPRPRTLHPGNEPGTAYWTSRISFGRPTDMFSVAGPIELGFRIQPSSQNVVEVVATIRAQGMIGDLRANGIPKRTNKSQARVNPIPATMAVMRRDLWG